MADCVICSSITMLKCSICKLTYYCSETCRLKDFDNHKILCRKSLPEYCKNIVKLRKEFSNIHGFNLMIGLSNIVHILIYDNNQHIISMRAPLSIKFCAICGNDIGYTSLNKVLISFKDGDNQIIEYERCDQCIISNYYLCKTTLCNTSTCSLHHHTQYKKNILLFMLTTKKNFDAIPKDIIYIILTICNKIKCY